MTAASFYMTSPRNTLTNNVAAGSESYGFEYDLWANGQGPLFSTDICPKYTQLGVFQDNDAHSNKYGFYIAGEYSPRTFPCEAFTYDAS